MRDGIENTSLINLIELAYAPIRFSIFYALKDDKVIDSDLLDSKIYMIAMRDEITFNNFSKRDYDSDEIEFVVKQKNNSEVLYCKFSIFQKYFNFDKNNDNIDIHFKLTEGKNPLTGDEINDIILINFIKNGKLSSWFTPEKFIWLLHKGKLDVRIEGDYKKFLKYKILYVGKSTEQFIFERLDGHSTLQRILAKEQSNDISFLFFKFVDNIQMKFFKDDFSDEDFADFMLGKQKPDEKRIFLDAEKALIKAMQPEFNKILYKSYPVSSDGLHSEKLDYLSYTFIDPITLEYKDNVINGGITGDELVVVNDQLTVYKK